MASSKGKKKGEEQKGGLPAKVAATPPALSDEQRRSLMETFKPKRQVILPSLNLQVGAPRILYIGDAIRVSTVRDPDPKKATDKPADVCTVTDMQTGEQFTLLVPAVAKGALEDMYPDAAYVGCAFYMEKLPKREGKRYFDFKLYECEVTPAK